MEPPVCAEGKDDCYQSYPVGAGVTMNQDSLFVLAQLLEESLVFDLQALSSALVFELILPRSTQLDPEMLQPLSLAAGDFILRVTYVLGVKCLQAFEEACRQRY